MMLDTTTATAVRERAGLACGEVRGGNEVVHELVEIPGLRGTLFSRPCHGPEGGDVHFLSRCGSGLLARVCVADVAGHGQTVAAIGREMHAHLRKSVNKFNEGRVMADLDRRLESQGLRAITTAALLTYYPPSRRLTLAYAGHPPGWHYHLATRTWSRLLGAERGKTDTGPVDLPLGTGLSPFYTRRRVRVELGDHVLLVTDGVLEAASPDGTEFGVEGVERALAGDVTTAADRLLAALIAHTGSPGLSHDDVTFFLGEFVEGPPGGALWNVLRNRILGRVL